MSNTNGVSALPAILLLMGALSVVSPARVTSAQSFPLQQVDQDGIDAYIHSRMQIANIPGLALGVVYGDEIAYLQRHGVAGPDRRAVTPQTPFILGSTSKSITALAVMHVVLTAVSIGWSVFRVHLTFYPRQRVQHAGG
ncbi:MAG: serine hydrolase domain-containing protein [Anaerolineae bacterium]